MGKIRIKTIGDEAVEKKSREARSRSARQKADAKKRSEAKRIVEEKEQKLTSEVSEAKIEEPKKEEAAKPTKKRVAKKAKDRRSKNYKAKAALVDKKQVYSLPDALTLLPKLNLASFDETVELHINTIDKGISGNITLPHGTGKQIRVEILNPQEDAKHVTEVIKKIENGTIDFDVLIATPDSMPRLAKVAKFLGPKGLMPNPKNGTVTPKPQDIAKKYAGGQIHYKTEAKFPLLHISVGKLSFGDKKLAENIKTFISAVDSKNIKTVTLKSTMSPGIKLDFTAI